MRYDPKHDFTKVMTLKGQGHRSKQMAPSDSLTLKNIYLDAKIVILSPLVQKLWSKRSFCIIMANVTCSRTSHVQTAQDVFPFDESPHSSYSVLKFGNNLPSRKQYMAQSVILYSSDIERSRSSVRSIIFCTAIPTLPMRTYVKFR